MINFISKKIENKQKQLNELNKKIDIVEKKYSELMKMLKINSSIFKEEFDRNNKDISKLKEEINILVNNKYKEQKEYKKFIDDYVKKRELASSDLSMFRKTQCELIKRLRILDENIKERENVLLK